MTLDLKRPWREVGFKLLQCKFCDKHIKDNAFARASHLRSKAHQAHLVRVAEVTKESSESRTTAQKPLDLETLAAVAARVLAGELVLIEDHTIARLDLADEVARMAVKAARVEIAEHLVEALKQPDPILHVLRVLNALRR